MPQQRIHGVQLAHAVVSRIAWFGIWFEGLSWKGWLLELLAEEWMDGEAPPLSCLAKTGCLTIPSDVVCTLPEMLQLLGLEQLFGKKGN